MDLTVVGTAYAVIFPVELPDKTFVATLVLATRYRSSLVWIGVSLAFLVQSAVAVAAGGLVSLLPATAVEAAAAALFLVGAIVLWRSAAGAAESEAASEREFAARSTQDVQGLRVVATSFAVLFLAEWGDLSQLFTAGLAARTGEPASVFAGAWLALVTVAGLAVLLGRTLLRYVPLSTVRRVAAGVCLALALLAAYEVVRGLG